MGVGGGDEDEGAGGVNTKTKTKQKTGLGVARAKGEIIVARAWEDICPCRPLFHGAGRGCSAWRSGIVWERLLVQNCLVVVDKLLTLWLWLTSGFHQEIDFNYITLTKKLILTDSFRLTSEINFNK